MPFTFVADRRKVYDVLGNSTLGLITKLGLVVEVSRLFLLERSSWPVVSVHT